MMLFDAWLDTALLRLEPVNPSNEEDALDPVFATVWLEQDPETSNIWLQITPQEAVLIASLTAGDEQLTPPQIEATGTAGSFVVTWSQPLPDGGRKALVLPLSISNADDLQIPLPWEFTGPRPGGVSLGDLSAAMVRVAAVGDEGDFVAAWVQADDDDDIVIVEGVEEAAPDGEAPDDSIYLQRFDANGNPAPGGPLRIEAPGVTNGTDGAPQVLGLGSDGFALAWMGEVGAGQWRWFVQCFSANGNPRGDITDLGLAADLPEDAYLLPIPAQLAALDN
jgi:hypothetical protein